MCYVNFELVLRSTHVLRTMVLYEKAINRRVLESLRHDVFRIDKKWVNRREVVAKKSGSDKRRKDLQLSA